jgi:uncharacterized membrane protein
MWINWVIVIVIALCVLSIPLEVYVIRRAAKQLPARQPGSPLQTLERRFAAGEISAEEFQYERYLLEKGE